MCHAVLLFSVGDVPTSLLFCHRPMHGLVVLYMRQAFVASAVSGRDWSRRLSSMLQGAQLSMSGGQSQISAEFSVGAQLNTLDQSLRTENRQPYRIAVNSIVLSLGVVDLWGLHSWIRSSTALPTFMLQRSCGKIPLTKRFRINWRPRKRSRNSVLSVVFSSIPTYLDVRDLFAKDYWSNQA